LSDGPPWASLGFEEPAAVFQGPTQNARVWSEGWARRHLFCPGCGAAPVEAQTANRRVCDFICTACAEEYELKSQNGRFGRKVVDGAWASMSERLAQANNPSLVLMAYDRARLSVTDLIVVPKHFFTPEIIERRKPLSPTARRAGWEGCNILLDRVPEVGKIHLIRAGAFTPRAAVLGQWQSTLFLREIAGASRGWLTQVMACVEAIGRHEFTLEEVYAFEPRLARIYPANNNIRPKIRQQLQVLRDLGWLTFKGRGHYALAAPL
jgi:type II restriction enzyme